jgi:hypothetical protein
VGGGWVAARRLRSMQCRGLMITLINVSARVHSGVRGGGKCPEEERST